MLLCLLDLNNCDERSKKHFLYRKILGFIKFIAFSYTGGQIVFDQYDAAVGAASAV